MHKTKTWTQQLVFHDFKCPLDDDGPYHGSELEVLAQVGNGVDEQRAVVVLEGDGQDVGEEVGGQIMQHLPLAAKLCRGTGSDGGRDGKKFAAGRLTDGRPGGRLPNVVELPVEGAHGVAEASNQLAAAAAVKFRLCLHALRLHHLTTNANRYGPPPSGHNWGGDPKSFGSQRKRRFVVFFRKQVMQEEDWQYGGIL